MGGDIPGIYKASQTSQAGQAAESSKSHGKFGRFSVVVGGGATTPMASKTDTSVTIGTVFSESIWDRFVDQFWETLGFFKGTSKSDWEKNEALLDSVRSGYAHRKVDLDGNAVAGSEVKLSANTRISIANKIAMGETKASEEQKAVAGELMLKIGREQGALQEQANEWKANDILQDNTLSIEQKANELFIACKTLHKMQPSSKMEGILGWTQQFILGTQKLNSEDKRALYQAFLEKCKQEGAPVPTPRQPTATEVHQVGRINPNTITLNAAFERLSLILNENGVSASLPEKMAACREFTAVVRREIAQKGEDDEDIRSIRGEFKALQASLKLGNPATSELNALKQELEGANRDLGLRIY